MGGAYPKSVAQELVDVGVVGSVIIDPSGVVSFAGSTGSQAGYMISTNTMNYTLWANLENPTQADRDTQNSCVLSTWDNYSSSSPENSRMNYCISN